MNIRRPVAAVVVGLALVGGPATLTACADPSGGPTSLQRNDGTPDDNTTYTSGDDPGGVSQGNVPRHDHYQENSTQNPDRNANSDSDK